MRIHTNLTAAELDSIIVKIIVQHKLNPTLRARITTHGSKSSTYGHEVVLTSKDKRDGEKRRQYNAFGHPFGPNGEYGGTYAEWGWFIAAIFDADYAAKAGPYVDRTMFDDWTESAFDEDMVHLRIMAADILTGDVLVGDNIPGSGVKPVRDVRRARGERSMTVDYTRRGGNGRYVWAETQQMNPRRVVTVARYVESDALVSA